MEHAERLKLISYLLGFVSDARKKRFEDVLSQRTSHIRIVIENVYQGHNASAVLRSCDCFGIQHVDFIENGNSLKINDEVTLGSHQWLSVHRHREEAENTGAALSKLKKEGYRIVAVTPHMAGCDITELDIDKKLALVFGTELEGISEEVSLHADEYVKIRMHGFTESFNVSVCAALCMFELTGRMRRDLKTFGLTQEEKSEVYLSWLKASIDHCEAIIANFLNKKKG